MEPAEPSLYHARISFSLNVKLLHPREVCDAAVRAWRAGPTSITLSQEEGFLRQIIGWREYMRGVYWAQMPAFAQRNFFGHKGQLPSWYWPGETRMPCSLPRRSGFRAAATVIPSSRSVSPKMLRKWLFLPSERARWITGQIFGVDGGMSALRT